MASNLLDFRRRRSPLQSALAGFIILACLLVLAGFIPTQWWAYKYNFDPRLGVPLLRASSFAIYSPVQWMGWGWRYGDYPQLRDAVRTLFLIGAASEVSALILTGLLTYWFGRPAKGMEGLHGTAHFAEIEDVDRTGFIDARGHEAQGVVVGSVMLGKSRRVIHPHHPQFQNRYVPVTTRQWRDGFRKRVVRDKQGRPKYKLRKSVVKKCEWLRDGGNTHLFGFCPTRSGKGVGMVIPTLLTWRHSVMVNDPKGEAWALSAGFRRAAGQHTIRFEPASSDPLCARWNPLDEIRAFTPNDVADAQTIMYMACDPKGEGLHDYFDKAGWEFMAAVALHVRYCGKPGSLSGCAQFLGDPAWDTDKQMYTEMMSAAHDPEGKMGWTDSMGESTKTHPMVANAAKTMLNKEDKDRSGVLSTAKTLLSLYLDPIVARNTDSSDFLVRDLMTSEKPVSLYFVVQPDQMERITSLTRLFYSIFIRRNAAEMQFEGGQSKASYTHQLLMIMDETASLKKLPILQEALGYVAGYGIRMFFLVQDIVQIEELYGEKQSFDSGAETRIAYAPNKIETAEKLARMTGKTTVTEESASNSRDLVGFKPGSQSLGLNKTARDLVTADEFMSLHDQDMVIFVKGQPPIYGRKSFYYEIPQLAARAAMEPPKSSSVLRQRIVDEAAGAPAEPAPVAPSPSDKWKAERDAMRAQIVQPRSQAEGGEHASTKPVTKGLVLAARSRYAKVEQKVSADDEAQIAGLVAAAGIVERATKVEAF